MRLSDAHRAVESGWLALMGAMVAIVFIIVTFSKYRQGNGCHIPLLNVTIVISEELVKVWIWQPYGADM